MTKKFELPKSFTCTKTDSGYNLIIKQVNPFWIGLYILFSLGIFASSLASSNHILLTFCVIPIALIVYSFNSKYLIELNKESIIMDGTKINFEEIVDIKMSRKTKSAGIGVQTGSVQKVSVFIKSRNRNYYLAQRLIEDNQHPLIYLLKKTKDQGLNFIDGLLKN